MLKNRRKTRRLVFIPNGAIGLIDGEPRLHRSYRPFLEELVKSFDQVIVSQFFVTGSKTGLYDWIISGLNKLGLENAGICNRHDNLFYKVLNYTAAIFTASKRVKDGTFFYICFPGHFPIIFSICCLLFNRRYGLYVRGDWFSNKNKFTKSLFDYLFRKAFFILVTGKDYLQKIKPINQRVEEVVPMIEFGMEDLYINRDYGLKNKINLLFLSRIEKAKGIFDILDAYESLRKKDKRIRLIVAGDGPEFAEVNRLCHTRGLSNFVVLHGMIKGKEKLEELYKSADIFVFPSHNEGFPRVLYEAMCFGLPILTTFVGSIDSVMKDGKNCLRINKNDWNDIEKKVHLLINNHKLREEIGKEAVKTMAGLFKRFGNRTHAKQVTEWIRKTETL